MVRLFLLLVCPLALAWACTTPPRPPPASDAQATSSAFAKPDATTAAASATAAPASAPEASASRPSPQALYQRGNAEYDRTEYATCAATFDAGLAAAQDQRQTENFAYASACCHALAGNTDEAFARLERAIAAGFRDAAHLAKDPDLQALRSDPRWAALEAKAAAAEEAYLASINPELKALFDADQADRQGKIDWKEVSARDAERRQKVSAILEAGGAKAADDYYHAAMVFQHHMEEASLARANELAAKALALDPEHPRARWLFAASKDRLLMKQKKPQLYGTQFHREDDQWKLYPVDPSITDEERARYNVPPLAVSRQRAQQMNARAPGNP